MIRKILLAFLAITLLSHLASFIGLKLYGYKNITLKQRVWVDGKFQPWGLLTPDQMEGTKTKTVKDSISTTQSYVWGENFSTVAMQNGEDVRMNKWSDSITKQLGARKPETNYFWGKSKLAEKAHGSKLEELLKGKTFTHVSVMGYASPEAGTPGSLLPDSIDEKNVTLAQNRAEYSLETIKALFRANGKSIDTVQAEYSGKELQLFETYAYVFAKDSGFAALKASNRSGKDTMGYNAHTIFSELRYTEVKMNYTEESKKTMIVTQPLLLLFLILLPLWQLLKWIFGRKLPGANFKWPKWGCKCTLPSVSWPRCNCNFVWPTFTGCCTLKGGSWKCCLCNKALRRLWRMRLKRIFKNILAALLFILWILFWVALAIAAIMFLAWYYAAIIIILLITLLLFLTSYVVDWIFLFTDWFKKKRCECFWWKLLSAGLAITVAILAWMLYNKPC